MRHLLKILAIALTMSLFTSCDNDREGLPRMNITDIVFITNESSHQIYMSNINGGGFPESITLDPTDFAVDGSDIWTFAQSYLDEVDMFCPPLSMVITIDGDSTYAVYYISDSSTCKCKSSVCKCGRNTADEYDVKCMCGADVINPCKYSNWVLVSVNGEEQTDNVIRLKNGEDNTVVRTYTITEERVEQTFSLLATE